MMHASSSLSLLLLTGLTGLLTAQTPLQVQPDPENVVASRLAGTWRADAALGERLGKKARVDLLVFQVDPQVAARIPAKFHEPLQKMRIFLAGTMTLRGKEHPFLLTETHGNPHLIWFRERGGDPMGDAESFNLMLAPGATPEQDLLFVGGDFNNQPFAPYGRAAAAAAPPAELKAAIADMLLLLTRKEHQKLIETYATPEELARLREKGAERFAETIADFGKDKAALLRQGLEKAQNLTPVLDAKGDEAVFEGAGIDRPLRFVRIDGRWHLGN